MLAGYNKFKGGTCILHKIVYSSGQKYSVRPLIYIIFILEFCLWLFGKTFVTLQPQNKNPVTVLWTQLQL